jgi:hypothetical protein
MVTQTLLEAHAPTGQALAVLLRDLAAAVDAYCEAHKVTRAHVAKEAGIHEKALSRALHVGERKNRKLAKRKDDLARPRQSTVTLATAESIARAIGRALVLSEEGATAPKVEKDGPS